MCFSVILFRYLVFGIICLSICQRSCIKVPLYFDATKKLKMQPAVLYCTLLMMPPAQLSFFFSVISLIWLFCLCPASPKRHHRVVQNLPKTSFLHQTNKFALCMKSIFSYLDTKAFRGTHSKTSHI